MIGLHLKSGDAVFKTGTGFVNDVSGVNQTLHGAIACVEKKQKHVMVQHGIPAVLLVLSDDMLVRRSMEEIFGTTSWLNGTRSMELRRGLQ